MDDIQMLNIMRFFHLLIYRLGGVGQAFGESIADRTALKLSVGNDLGTIGTFIFSNGIADLLHLIVRKVMMGFAGGGSMAAGRAVFFPFGVDGGGVYCPIGKVGSVFGFVMRAEIVGVKVRFGQAGFDGFNAAAQLLVSAEGTGISLYDQLFGN